MIGGKKPRMIKETRMRIVNRRVKKGEDGKELEKM